MEFHRTAITERVFEIAGKRTWQQNDFELDPLGVVRLAREMARAGDRRDGVANNSGT